MLFFNEIRYSQLNTFIYLKLLQRYFFLEDSVKFITYFFQNIAFLFLYLKKRKYFCIFIFKHIKNGLRN